MAGPTSATRMSCWRWAAIRLRTIRSASASSWRPSGIATRSSCCVDPRFNRTAAVADRFVQIRAGTDIAFLAGLINHALREQPVSRRVRPAVHQRAVPRERALRLRRGARACSRAGTTSGRPTPTHRAGATSSDADGFAKRRSDAAAPALGVPGDEALLRALHAGDGRRTSAAARADDFVEGRPTSSPRPYTRRSRRHDDVRARVDAPQPLGAADSRRGDAAAAARQHRPSRRRAQRAARPRQHPGRHRLRHGVSQPARLHRQCRRPITRRSTRSSRP